MKVSTNIENTFLNVNIDEVHRYAINFKLFMAISKPFFDHVDLLNHDKEDNSSNRTSAG